ncbi:helix-turn-helix domain-containing protein [Amycolatopsis sp. NPDC059021]|uniref:helix-turn-helix domain-containing protein n=1 Tax=Amycolatopsis sp. NPDC059021 TaxID=3346704 RepID=UPI00366C1282
MWPYVSDSRPVRRIGSLNAVEVEGMSPNWRVEPAGQVFLSGRSARKGEVDQLCGGGDDPMTETGEPGDNTAEEQREADEPTRSTTEEMVRRYQAGETLTELVNSYDLSFRKVRETLLEAGVTLRPAMPVTAPAPPGMVEAYREGKSIKETAAQFGLTYGQTRRMLLDAGVGLRRRGRPR